MNAIVIYSSKTGFTKKYADWIAARLQVVSYDINDVNTRFLKKFDTIIFGGGVYAGKISDIKFVSKRLPKLDKQHWIVFAVGLTPSDNLDNQVKLQQTNFTQEEAKRVDFYYFQGGLNKERLPRTQKIVVSGLRKIVGMQKNPSADDQWILEALDKDTDFTQEEAINHLVALVEMEQ
jgi:menaquinone-dependent protoporphyrinogen IX oxidase